MFDNKMDEIYAKFDRLTALKFSRVAKDLAGPSVMVMSTYSDRHEEYKIFSVGYRRVVDIFDDTT